MLPPGSTPAQDLNSTLVMELYFLETLNTLSGLTAMEKALARILRTFDSCVFDATSLVNLAHLLQRDQDELQNEHPDWKAVDIHLKPEFGSMPPVISLGQYSSYYAWCIKIPCFRYSGDASKLNTIDMNLYYLIVPDCNGVWMTPMERELLFHFSSFDKCVFDEEALVELIGRLHTVQNEVLKEHPQWTAVEIRMEKNSDTGTRTKIRIGRIAVGCREVYHLYAEPDKVECESVSADQNQ